MSFEFPHRIESRKKRYPERDDNKKEDSENTKKNELMQGVQYLLKTLKELIKRPTPKI